MTVLKFIRYTANVLGIILILGALSLLLLYFNNFYDYSNIFLLNIAGNFNLIVSVFVLSLCGYIFILLSFIIKDIEAFRKNN